MCVVEEVHVSWELKTKENFFLCLLSSYKESFMDDMVLEFDFEGWEHLVWLGKWFIMDLKEKSSRISRFSGLNDSVDSGVI